MHNREWEQRGKIYHHSTPTHEAVIRQLNNGRWGLFGKHRDDTAWELLGVHQTVEQAMK